MVRDARRGRRVIDEAGLAELRSREGIDGLVPIGQGGAAAVYRGRQTRFDRDVAVKVLSSPLTSDKARRRFDRECRALGKLSQHPCIVTVYDSGVSASGFAYLVMELCSGGSLAEALRGGPLAPREVTQLGVQLSSALHWAHQAGTLHRDIKPGNVLRTRLGEPVLADFGIAAVELDELSVSVHDSLTPVHAAPEVLLHGGGNVASDIWSLASTLWTLLAGRPPFARAGDDGLMGLMSRIVNDPLPTLEVPGSAALVTVLAAGLVKDPAQRIPSAAEFGRRLQAVQEASGWPVTPFLGDQGAGVTSLQITEKTPERPEPPAPPPQPTAPPPAAPADPPPAVPHRNRRPRYLIPGAAVLVVGAVVAVGAVLFTGGSSPSPQPVVGDLSALPTGQIASPAASVATLRSDLVAAAHLESTLGLRPGSKGVAGIYDVPNSITGRRVILAAQPLDAPGGVSKALSSLRTVPDVTDAGQPVPTTLSKIFGVALNGSMTCELGDGANALAGLKTEACVWRDSHSAGLVVIGDPQDTTLDGDDLTDPEQAVDLRLEVEHLD